MKNLFTILALTLFIASCGDTTSITSNETKEVPIEQKLAIIDNIYDTADVRAIRIKSILNVLAINYSEPKDSIGEYTYRAQSVLQDKGIQETCLGILEQMFLTDQLDNTTYKDAITMYLVIRTK